MASKLFGFGESMRKLTASILDRCDRFGSGTGCPIVPMSVVIRGSVCWFGLVQVSCGQCCLYPTVNIAFINLYIVLLHTSIL